MKNKWNKIVDNWTRPVQTLAYLASSLVLTSIMFDTVGDVVRTKQTRFQDEDKNIIFNQLRKSNLEYKISVDVRNSKYSVNYLGRQVTMDQNGTNSTYFVLDKVERVGDSNHNLSYNEFTNYARKAMSINRNK